MKKRELLHELFIEDLLITFEDIDEAIIGTTDINGVIVTVYDYDKCVKLMMKNDGITETEAIEHLDFNFVGQHLGENTPIFIHNMGLFRDEARTEES